MNPALAKTAERLMKVYLHEIKETEKRLSFEQPNPSHPEAPELLWLNNAVHEVDEDSAALGEHRRLYGQNH